MHDGSADHTLYFACAAELEVVFDELAVEGLGADGAFDGAFIAVVV